MIFWRNQELDIAYLTSLSDDLKYYWQLQATKWEMLHQTLLSQEQSKGLDHKSARAKLNKTLNNDSEYRELRGRIQEELLQAREISRYLEYPYPKELKGLDWSFPIQPRKELEAAIEALDTRLLPLAQHSSYPFLGIKQLFSSLFPLKKRKKSRTKISKIKSG